MYESAKAENEQLKPVVEQFEMQQIYEDLSTIKLEKHVERLSNKKVQVSDAKEVVSSGKFAENAKFADITDEDRKRMKRNPALWQKVLEGYKKS